MPWVTDCALGDLDQVSSLPRRLPFVPLDTPPSKEAITSVTAFPSCACFERSDPGDTYGISPLPHVYPSPRAAPRVQWVRSSRELAAFRVEGIPEWKK